MSKGAAARFATNAGASLVGAILNLAVLLWVNQYLLRRIDAEEYSLVPVLTSLMIFGELFRDAFAGGVSRFLVEADAKNDEVGLSRIVSSMLPILAAVSIVLATAGAWAALNLDHLIKVDPDYRSDAQVMLILLLFSLCLEIAAVPFSLGLFVKMKFVTLNVVNLICLLLRITLLFILLFGVGPKAMWLVISMVFGNTLSVIIRVYYSRRLLPTARFQPSLMSRHTIMTLLSFSLWTIIQGIARIVQRAAPALLLNRYSTPAGVVAFHLGNLPDLQIRKLISAAANPALPELTTIFASGGKEALKVFFFRGGKYYLWAAMFLAPMLVIFGEPLIILYVGPKYLETAFVLLWIFGAYPFVWASGMFYQVAYACGEIKAFNVLNLIVICLTILLLWLFVVLLKWGAIGAGMALGLGSGLGHILVIWPGSLRFVGGRWRDFLMKTFLPGITPAVATIVVNITWLSFNTLESWGAIILACGLSGITYMVTLFSICTDADDKVLLSKVIHHFRASSN